MLPDEDLAGAIGLAATPADLGEIVAGLLGIAREAALRRRDLLLRLDGIIAGYSQDDFFDAVPGLRRAFRGYTPRERSLVADILLGRDSLAALARFTASEDIALEIARFESDVFDTVERFLGEAWTRS